MTRNLFTSKYCGCMTETVLRLLAEYYRRNGNYNRGFAKPKPKQSSYHLTQDGRYRWYTPTTISPGRAGANAFTDKPPECKPGTIMSTTYSNDYLVFSGPEAGNLFTSFNAKGAKGKLQFDAVTIEYLPNDLYFVVFWQKKNAGPSVSD